MKAPTLRMKAGLIAHSTETVATTAVTSAGIAATSENSATTRECSARPHARRVARRAACAAPSDQDENADNDHRVARQNRQHDARVGMIGEMPAKITKVASARISAAPTATGPKRRNMRFSGAGSENTTGVSGLKGLF